LRIVLIAVAALTLAGCLSTRDPVFDETNSDPVGEIPEFMAFVTTWEAFAGADDSPRELIEEGARGIVVDGILVVQERSDYYALAVLGQRPVSCMIYADSGMPEVAAAHGVTVEIDAPDDGRTLDEGPVPVVADGPQDKLLAFIRDQFANQRLACIAAPREGE